MDNKKYLIEYKKEKFFSKIFNFFKSIFYRKGKLENENLIFENSIFLKNDFDIQKEKSIEKEILIKDINIKNEKEIDDSKEDEKSAFLKLYNDYRNGRISSKDISLYNLVRINRMIDEEMKIYKG